MSAATGALRAERRGSLGEWLVILVVIVALAAGWGVRTAAENEVREFSAGGITASYPARWLPSVPADGVLRFRNMRAGGLPATLEVRATIATGTQTEDQALALEADALALSRGRDLTAYRTLERGAAPAYAGQQALRVTYAFVSNRPDAFQQQVPVVMLGEDVLVCRQGRVVVCSLQAPESEFAGLRRHLQTLVESTSIR